MLGKINHVMMWASDLSNVANWYKEKLGFQVTYHAPNEFLSMFSEEMGRLDFHASGDDKSGIGNGPLPYYLVKDIAKTKESLESRGVRVKPIQQVGDSPKHTWFWDCEGNTIGIEEV